MAQLICSSCGDTLGEGDQFCGNCGTDVRAARRPARWPDAGTGASKGSATDRQVVSGQAAPAGPFFQHSPRRESGRLSNATRYLCAAAYLDPPFANSVIRELIASHRGVVPSLDFDLGPIIRHCLHARRITLVHDILLSTFLILGLFIAPIATILVLIIAFIVGLLPGARQGRRRVSGKFLAAAGIAAAVIVIIVLLILKLLLTLAVTTQSGSSLSASLVPSVLWFAVSVVVYLALTGVTQFGYTHAQYRTLSERLRYEAPPTQFPKSNDRVESRLAEVEAAQWGNVTLYGGENPFIGSGSQRGHVWSIAVQLDRAHPARQNFLARPASRSYVPIDPVELHQVIRDRLLKLKEPSLPPNERISALTVEDHVVGEGLRRWDSPLIDPAEKTPYSQASLEAIQALIRHPQAGLRYYQRVCLSDKGPPVLSDGQEVIEGADQGIVVSAFVHLAVEGRMLYLEFVTMILPPIWRPYQVIDRLPVVSSGKFLTTVIGEAARSLFRDTIRAPVGIVSALRLMSRERRSFEDEAASSTYHVVGDFGARTSVRELGAAPSPDTYIQKLDAEKYTKIVERLLTETVLDFLAAKGVDTSAFAMGTSTIINNGTVINADTMSGQFAFGNENVLNQQPAPVVVPAPGSVS